MTESPLATTSSGTSPRQDRPNHRASRASAAEGRPRPPPACTRPSPVHQSLLHGMLESRLPPRARARRDQAAPAHRDGRQRVGVRGRVRRRGGGGQGARSSRDLAEIYSRDPSRSRRAESTPTPRPPALPSLPTSALTPPPPPNPPRCSRSSPRPARTSRTRSASCATATASTSSRTRRESCRD